MIVHNEAAACPYRVGDYLFSESKTHPSTSWPGTSWVQIQGRMIVGTSETYPVGSTGGAANVTLKQAQLPVISGSIYAGAGASGPDGGGWGAFRQGSGVFSTHMEMQNGQPKEGMPWPTGSAGSAWSYADLRFGEGQAHENLPPYRAAYIWRRTA